MLENAKSLFEKSLSLDNSYYPSKQNLVIINFLNSYLNNTINDFFKTSEFKNLEEKTQSDLKVISMILDGEKPKKVEKILLTGSEISSFNLYRSYNDIESNHDTLSEFKIDNSIRLFGLEPPYDFINTKYGNLNFKLKKNKDFIIYELEDQYIIESSVNASDSIPSLIYKNKKYFLVE